MAGNTPKLPTLQQALGKHGGPKLPSGANLPSLSDALNGSGHPTKAAPKHHGGGGFLHELGHIAAQTGTDLYNTAIHSPAGLYQTGKAIGEAATGNPHDLIRIGKATGQGFLADIQHPLRHPGNTLLDALALASLGAGTAARIGEVGRAAEAGATASDVLKAAVKGPGPVARDIAYGDTKIPAGTYSRSALKRGAQHLYDQFQQRFPDVRLPLRNLHERVGHELGRNRRIEDAVGRAPAGPLTHVRLGKDALAKRKAMQVAAEGVPVADRIAFHQQQLAEFTAAGKTKLAAATRKEIALLHGADKYVRDDNGFPRINDPKLEKVFVAARDLARKRETLLGESTRIVRVGDHTERVPALADATAAGRLTKPADILSPGHTFDPHLIPELFRFPYRSDLPKGALGKMAGYKGGVPLDPGSLTHEFAGGLLKSGAFRNDTERLVAESYLEAHRFAALMKHRDQFLGLAHDERLDPVHDVPIRADQLKNRPWPKAIQDLSEKPALSKNDLEALGKYYEDTRQHLFPDTHKILADEKTLANGVHPDVKWIDKRILGGLNEANPLAVSGGGRKALSVFDAINNASRAAILYLKPAYGVPNLLGNAALNLVQQGWAAPVQIARSVRLWVKLDDNTKSALLHAMGEGVTGALHAEQGPLTKSVNVLANLWQKPVDTPFRANAILYEARRAGYRTPAQLAKLTEDVPALTRIAREASAAAIDYGNLGPIEQNIVRRVIFFYPWVKGSSQFAGRFLTTHHMQAALLAQEGKQGAKQDAADLGALPSYMDGLFKVGQRGVNPLVVNPNSAGILQTPAQLLQTIRELGSKNPGEAFQLSQNFTPAITAALALAGVGRQRNESALHAVQRELVNGLPAVTTLQGALHPPAGSAKPRIYPRTRRDVLLHFLLGGLAPSPVNLSKAQQAAYLEKHPR